MKIIDANIVLRYLLKDNTKLYNKAIEIIDNNNIFITSEVIAEIVYVLGKIYKIPKKEIKNVLLKLFANNNIMLADKKLINEALDSYHKYNLHFLDTILLAYHKLKEYEVITFNKKLAKLLR